MNKEVYNNDYLLFIMTSKKFKNSRASIKTREWNENENPTPLHFDKFLPWFCLKMNVSTLVTVERVNEEDYKLHGNRVNVSRSRSMENTHTSHLILDTQFSTSSSCSGSNTLNIKSYYNERNQLIEVAIIDCRIRINRKVIQAINLCLPFHENFKKFIIRGTGLTETVLYEIGKLLPHSNITDVCLDDTYLPEGNYYVLFERINQLQSISLCRCKINDEVCKMIAQNLDFESPASMTLKTIDLTSNNITNFGASYLGFMLRKNRSLLYLNLSDNLIGDIGASHILRSLMLFSLTEDEEIELKRTRCKYAAEKIEEYKKCEKKVRDFMKSEENKENASTRPSVSAKSSSVSASAKFSSVSVSAKTKKKGKISKIIKTVEAPVKEQAEKMAIKHFGNLNDIFGNENVTYKNDKLHCIGNLKLCYLNLAYNDIKYFSIKKLCEVLKYQSSISRFQCRGLLKVVIDGNDLPVGGELLETIQNYLNKAVEKFGRSSVRSVSCYEKKG